MHFCSLREERPWDQSTVSWTGESIKNVIAVPTDLLSEQYLESCWVQPNLTTLYHFTTNWEATSSPVLSMFSLHTKTWQLLRVHKWMTHCLFYIKMVYYSWLKCFPETVAECWMNKGLLGADGHVSVVMDMALQALSSTLRLQEHPQHSLIFLAWFIKGTLCDIFRDGLWIPQCQIMRSVQLVNVWLHEEIQLDLFCCCFDRLWLDTQCASNKLNAIQD